MLGSPILYLKGMRILMFQLSGFYCKTIVTITVNTDTDSNIKRMSSAPDSLCGSDRWCHSSPGS